MLPEIRTAVPGPKSLAFAAALKLHESRNVTYTGARFPVFWERAEGANVWDADGNRFLDLTAAFAVASLGHGHPKLVKAMEAQAGILLHGMGDVHPSPGKVELCRLLSEWTFERWGVGSGRTILCSSGFEAVEAALKTAFLQTGKPGVISFEGCYHGLGFGALGAGGFARFRDPFLAQLPENGLTLPFPHIHAPKGSPGVGEVLARVRGAIEGGGIGAILVEPVQGRGGKRIARGGFLRGLREICDAMGVVLVFDEIMTGLNRCGAFLAADRLGVRPDVLCLGKALTGGFPLSACTGRDAVMSAWPESTGEALHTSTFLGHPVGCAMAVESLRLHSDPALATRVRKTGARFRTLLEGLRPRCPRAGRVRGTGLMLGLEVVDPATGAPDGATAAEIMVRSLAEGLILLGEGEDGHVLAFTPPFFLSEEEMVFAVETLAALLG
jgi:4-aminobutyrate aminotransferase-like enzyme